MAVSKLEGTGPTESDSFMILRVGLIKAGNSSLKSFDGVGSNVHVVDLEEVTKLVRTSEESGSNCERVQLD